MAGVVLKTENCLEGSLERYIREENLNWLAKFIE